MIENPTTPSFPDAISIRDLCQDSLEQVRDFAEEKQLHLYTVLDNHVRTLFVEEARIRGLVSALLLNAIVATPDGGSVGLEVVGDAAHETVHLTVWDSSSGMDPLAATRLFLQPDPSNRQEQLLAQLPELVVEHEGVLSVDTSAGTGLRVTVSLPWVPPPAARDSSRGGRGERILIVDDDDLNAYVVSTYLSRKGYCVETAANGAEALPLLEKFRPALILMDIHMPLLNGLETIRRIRRHPDLQLAGTPIIALTILSMSSDKYDCLDAGANTYISKPISLRWLNRKILEHLPS